jgi:hypothetical protein
LRFQKIPVGGIPRFASFATFCSNSLQTFCDCGMPNAVKLREVMSRQKPSFLENQLLYYEGMVEDITVGNVPKKRIQGWPRIK